MLSAERIQSVSICRVDLRSTSTWWKLACYHAGKWRATMVHVLTRELAWALSMLVWICKVGHNESIYKWAHCPKAMDLCAKRDNFGITLWWEPWDDMVNKWSLDTISTDRQESFEDWFQTESPNNGNGDCAFDTRDPCTRGSMAEKCAHFPLSGWWDRLRKLTLGLLRVLAKGLTTLRLSFSCKMGITAVPISYSFYEDIMKKMSEKCLAFI